MKFITLLIILFASLNSFSQDILYKNDNTKLEVKILEINTEEIKYKLFNYLDGPIIIVSKNDVALIIYQNGTHEVFKAKSQIQNSNTTSETIKQFTDYKENLISFNTLDLMNACFNLGYTRDFFEHQFNLYVPLTLGFAEPSVNQGFIRNFATDYISDFKYTKKVIETGIGFNIIVNPKSKVSYFVGPYIGIAQYNGTYIHHVQDYSSVYPYSKIFYLVERGFVLNRSYFMINNGFNFKINDRFNINLNMGVGFKKDYFIANNPNDYLKGYTNNYINSPNGAFKIGVHMGYRF